MAGKQLSCSLPGFLSFIGPNETEELPENNVKTLRILFVSNVFPCVRNRRRFFNGWSVPGAGLCGGGGSAMSAILQ